MTTQSRLSFSVAPMMGFTDRHGRRFLRALSPSALLHSEMVAAQAVNHGDQERLLGFDPKEKPLALQLGGSCPEELAQAAASAAAWGYDEINLNLGCPSDRVRGGGFGACLMREPSRVRDCLIAMREGSGGLPVTLKCRIGIDDQSSYDFFREFVDVLSAAPCEVFFVHARIAILGGLSPKENREIPPLCYEHVYRLKRERPDLWVALNGGIRTVDEAEAHLQSVDAIMIGREAFRRPWFLAELEERLGTRQALPGRYAVLSDYLPYVDEQLRAGYSLLSLIRPAMGLFQGRRGGKAFRRYLSENASKAGAGAEVLERAAQLVSPA